MRLEELLPDLEALSRLQAIQGLVEKTAVVGVASHATPAEQVAAAEFILEGLWAKKRISRNEEHEFVAARSAILAGSVEPDVESGRRRQLN